MSPLHAAVLRDDLAELDRLLGLRFTHPEIQVNAQDEDGRTPLHYACLFRLFSAAERLKSAGALFSVRDKQGDSPVDLFFATGDPLLFDDRS